MKAGRNIWLVLGLAAFVVIQCLAAPVGRPVFMHQIFDEEGDTIDISLWSADSLSNFADSLLMASQDSVRNEFLFIEVNDTIQEKVDSVFREIFVRDSLEQARIAFEKKFAAMSKKEQKKWIYENVTLPAQIHMADSIMAVKDSLQAIRDSIIENTPRILDTPFIPDSLHYKRIVLMKQDTRFGDISFHKLDTTFNAHFYDYPFFRQDVNATWQGIAGSAVQPYTFHKREEEENAIFFTPYRSWTYTPSNVPMYNTKTPYTELGYWGTLLSGQDKEEINLRLLTTQNITPAANITFELNKYGGGGMLMKSTTAGYDMALTTSYMGKRYNVHAGWLHDKITRIENGGIRDNMWIRDTVVQSREILVNLSEAENTIKRNTLFLNHSLRIPFGSDSLTTAFVGHTTEWNVYTKYYTDNITDDFGRKFYNNNFFINPSKSADTLRTMRLDNKFFLRLQPWKENSALSRIDVGIGDKLLSYADCINDSTGFSRKTYENNIYAYAGLKGMFKQYFNWGANAQFYFAGRQAGDFNVDANIGINLYPFRKHRNSPLSLGAHFHTDLTSPDHYEQRILTNHYRWDNDFNRKSNTRIGVTLDIPVWNLDADISYSLLTGRIYYDSTGMISQFTDAMNVLSASLRKEFKLWWFHLDNRILFQMSSNQDVIPVPMLSLNLRYYFEFPVVKNVLKMQLGANGLFTTKWHMPGFNPNVGVFFNQTQETYGACPYIDVFLNMQWKRACIFIKCENINQGAPMDSKDYFTAHNYIHTQRCVKFGIYWPFYVQPNRHIHGSSSDGHGHDHGNAAKPAKEIQKSVG
ncbi:MAG: putative porin [Bacteroidales bacterium]|nr:putative porin [Candidatus Hennigimonas equi]